MGYVPNDKEQLASGIAAMGPVVSSIAKVLADSGYQSEAAVRQVEQDLAVQPTGATVYSAPKRPHHQRSVRDLEQREQPPAVPAEAIAVERMEHRASAAGGSAFNKLRPQTVMPVFVSIKSATEGGRQFSLRGMEKAALERTLVSTTYNLKAKLNAASTERRKGGGRKDVKKQNHRWATRATGQRTPKKTSASPAWNKLIRNGAWKSSVSGQRDFTSDKLLAQTPRHCKTRQRGAHGDHSHPGRRVVPSDLVRGYSSSHALDG